MADPAGSPALFHGLPSVSLTLPNGDSLSFPKSGSFLGDLRLVAGHRHTRHWQSVVSVTPVACP